MLRRAVPRYCPAPPHVRWRFLEKSSFDVCVVGAGPAGVAAALRAADYGRRVCLVEARRVGGCDLWNGALQSKVMWEMSNFLAKANGDAARRVYNTTIANFMELDEERMRETLHRASKVREQQLLTGLRAAKVSLIYGWASFASPHELEVRNREAREYRTILADYFIIATGALPNEHPYVKFDHKHVVTSNELMMMPLPKSMVIVGAGMLGSEFAAIYARLGKTKVYLLDKAERIMPKEDDDIVEKIKEDMEAHGVVIHQGSVLYDMQTWDENDAAMEKHPKDPSRRSGVRYTIMNRKTRELEVYEVERALIAMGRRPNYAGLGLINAQCTVRAGALVLDAFGKCVDHEHIYAIGDAANDTKLVSVGETKGRLVVDHIFGVHRTEPLQHNFTRLGFLTTAVSSVGMNEKQCQKQNISYIMAKYDFEFCSRTIAANSTNGFVKILATNDSRKTLLGVRVVGMNASTIIELASAAIRRKQTAYDLCGLLTAYPSVSQAFLECLRIILGCSTLKHGSFPGLVCQVWTPTGYEQGRAYKALPLAEELQQDHLASRRQWKDLESERRYFQERVSQTSSEELSEAKRVAEAMEHAAATKVAADVSALPFSFSSSDPSPSAPAPSLSPSDNVKGA